MCEGGVSSVVVEVLSAGLWWGFVLIGYHKHPWDSLSDYQRKSPHQFTIGSV